MSRAVARARYFLLAVGVFFLDQVTKLVVGLTLPLHEGRVIIPGFFNLTHVENRGAAFGILSDSPSQMKILLLVVFSVVALAIIFFLLWRGAGNRRSGYGLALIFGGAVGNLLDRLRQASVVDFLDFHLGGYHWPAFNVADSAIVLGASLLLFEIIFVRTRQESSAAG